MPDARTRLVATTTMASTLAHEVNQPLTAAANYMHACASRLRSRGEGFEDLLAMIEHASRETLRAAWIIADAQSQSSPARSPAATRILRTMIERVTSALALPGATDVEIATAILLTHFVVADRIQIEQVFTHLLRNACEARSTAAPNPASRSTRRRSGTTSWCGSKIMGRAFRRKRCARLFDPHFTSKATGLGLGMPICKTIVEAHGGRIWAENCEGGGAAFNVALAAADQPIQQQFG